MRALRKTLSSSITQAAETGELSADSLADLRLAGAAVPDISDRDIDKECRSGSGCAGEAERVAKNVGQAARDVKAQPQAVALMLLAVVDAVDSSKIAL